HAAMMGTALDPVRRPTPRNEGVTVSDDVEAVFEKALALDPRVRYRDAGVFWDELEAAIGAPLSERSPGSMRDYRAENPSTRVERIEVVGVPAVLRGSGMMPRVLPDAASAEASVKRRDSSRTDVLEFEIPASSGFRLEQTPRQPELELDPVPAVRRS